MGGSLIRWIFQPKSINTGSEKKRFTTFFFLGGGLQGAVYQIQKSLIMAALAARCHLIRMGLVSLDQNCNFYRSQPVARIVSDDNNRIQFLRSEWNNKVLVYVSWTFMSPPLQKEARLFSSFQFFVPKYALKERENWWHKIFFSNINTRCLNISNSSILSNHLSEIFLSSKVAHLLEPVFAFASHTCESAKAQSLSAIFEKHFLLRLRISLSLHLRWTCELASISIYVYVCICICIARVNQSSELSMEWHTYNYRAEYVFNWKLTMLFIWWAVLSSFHKKG